jgi:hypothetical protein
MTNTLAYYSYSLSTAVESFIVPNPSACAVKLFTAAIVAAL